MKRSRLYTMLLSAALLGASAASFAAAPTAAAIGKALPNVGKIESVTASPIKGIYEVATDSTVVYVTEDLSYLFAGHLLDIKNKRSLTEPIISKMQDKQIESAFKELQALKGDIQKALPGLQKTAITETKGNGAQKIYVFTDAKCSFCRRFEETLDKMDNITIYRIPVAYLGPESARLASVALCSKDKQVATWKEISGKGATMAGAKGCEDGDKQVQANNELAKSWKVTGTPSMFRADGDRWARGYMDVENTKIFLEKGSSALLQSMEPRPAASAPAK